MDHHLSKEARYHQFCAEKPRALYTMDQNVGLVEFKLPVRGEGFKLRVRFKRNPRRKLICVSVSQFRIK